MHRKNKTEIPAVDCPQTLTLDKGIKSFGAERMVVQQMILKQISL